MLLKRWRFVHYHGCGERFNCGWRSIAVRGQENSIVQKETGKLLLAQVITIGRSFDLNFDGLGIGYQAHTLSYEGVNR